MVQWLRLCAATAEDIGSIPGWGTKFLYSVGHNQKGKKKKSEPFESIERAQALGYELNPKYFLRTKGVHGLKPRG